MYITYSDSVESLWFYRCSMDITYQHVC